MTVEVLYGLTSRMDSSHILGKVSVLSQESTKMIVMGWAAIHGSTLSCAVEASTLCWHRQEQEEPQPGSPGRGRSTLGLAPPASELAKGRMEVAQDAARKGSSWAAELGRRRRGLLCTLDISGCKVLPASSHWTVSFPRLLYVSTD